MTIHGASDSTIAHEKEEFARFRRWLFSLSQQELLNYMQFTFQTCPGTNESHECDLLKEMVQLQPPLQTPVHPRAMGYKPRSQFGPTLDYEHGKGKSRWTKPRLFQWSERPSYRPRARLGRPQRRFDVIARNKVAPWGEVYSLGTTREQLEEDRRILERTFLDETNETSRQALFRDMRSAHSIIRMLQVVSRGHFLKPQTQSSISCCTSWLQPTERWFSLSLYLASRYQVSLWESFHETSKKTSQPIKYEPDILRVAIPAAVKMGLREAMEMDRERLDYLRDSLTWNVLAVLGMSYSGKDWDSLHMSWMQIPLLQSEKPVYQLQTLVGRSLQHSLVAEIEKSILNDPDPVKTPIHKESKKRKKKNKSKKRRGRKSVPQSIQQSIQQPIHDDKSSEDEKGTKEELFVPSFDFPDNDTSPRSRNRNVIFSLSILEDVLENAFRTVGLEPTQPSEEPSETKEKEDTEAKQPYFHSRTTNNGPRKSDSGENGQDGLSYPEFMSAETIEILPFETETNFELTRSQTPIQMPSAPPMEYYPLPGSDMTESSYSPNVLPTDFYRPGPMESFSFGRTGEENALDEWLLANLYQTRERSILTDFFQSQEERSDDDEKLMAASTAASISSSTCIDSTVAGDAEEMEKGTPEESAFASDMVTITEDDNSLARQSNKVVMGEKHHETESRGSSQRSIPHVPTTEIVFDMNTDRKSEELTEMEVQSNDMQTSSSVATECRSPSPEAPKTPPPTLSPILLSLADLRDLRHSTLTPERRKPRSGGNKPTRTFSDAPIPGSLPSSPVLFQKDGITQSWSREDLHIATFRDDHRIKLKKVRQPRPHRATELQQTYKSVAVKSLAKPIASSKSGSVDFRAHFLEASNRRDQQRESCARSETAVEGQREDHQWHDSRKHMSEEIDSKSVIKDETTTITSALSHRESDDIASIRDGKCQKQRRTVASTFFSNKFSQNATLSVICASR
jgi:hypothetical protein